jgi:hypothetical protein
VAIRQPEVLVPAQRQADVTEQSGLAVLAGPASVETFSDLEVSPG